MTNTKHTSKEEWITTADGHEIYTKTWIPAGKPVAAVVFVHGFGEHIVRYDHVFEEFNNAGLQVHAYDQRGFGKTGKKAGTLGNTGGYDCAIPDVTAALERGKIEGLPLFLMGHSYGGAMVLNYDCIGPLRTKLSGVISSAPLIMMTPKTRPFDITIGFAGVISKLLPSFQIGVGLPSDTLSRDPTEVNKYVTDPLVHGYITTKGVYDMITNGKALLATRYKDITKDVPLLICHGDSDGLTDSNATKEFFDKIQVNDKELKICSGYYHEMHNEPQAERKFIIDTYIQWILKHVPSSSEN